MKKAIPCQRCDSLIENVSTGQICPRCFFRDVVPKSNSPRPGPPTSLSIAEVARQFDGLEIIEFLGSGGMGSVYLAHQPKLERLAALKVLAPEMSGSEEFVLRFENEARALAKLHHPNIVTLYEHGRSKDGLLYLLMEYVDGSSLKDLLNEGPIDTQRAAAICSDVCLALQAAHQRGVVHRDVKPSNILLSTDHSVKLADFGLARLVSDEESGRHLTLTGEVLGTFDYTAPEQRHARSGDHRVDLFSLGVTLFEMMTGEIPRGIPDQSSLQLDKRLVRVANQAMQANPDLRFQSAEDMHRRLAPCTKPQRDYRSLYTTAAVLAAIACVTGWKMLHTSTARTIDYKRVWTDDFSQVPLSEEWAAISHLEKKVIRQDAHLRWTIEGPSNANAALLSDRTFDVVPDRAIRFEWEVGDLQIVDGFGYDYALEFGLVGTETIPKLAHSWVNEGKSIYLMLRADASATWSLLLFYKDGSKEGKNASQNHGIIAKVARLQGWDGQSFTKISIDLLPDGVMAGWTGNESAITVPWKDMSFSPINPKGLGDAVRVLSFAQNASEGGGSGGHTLKRFSVYRAED